MESVPVKTIADLRGRPVTIPAEPGGEYYVRRALHGTDYPAIYPDVFHPKTIVDVGAHVGAATLFFHHAYPGAKIWCFEPNPVTFALLVGNISGEIGIEARQVALGARNEGLTLFSGAFSSLQASLVPNEENRETGTFVHVRRIDEVLNEIGVENISILKVDTEGMEVPILVTLGARLADVEVIYLEYHSESDRREIDRMLEQHFVLFSSQAAIPDRGTVCYAARDRLAEWHSRTVQPRFAFPKGGPP